MILSGIIRIFTTKNTPSGRAFFADDITFFSSYFIYTVAKVGMALLPRFKTRKPERTA